MTKQMKDLSSKNQVLEDAINLDELDHQGGHRTARLTPVRRLVLKLLKEHPDGIKAYDLLELLRQHQKNATPPTIYRALDFLMTQGLARRVNSMSLFIACTRLCPETKHSGFYLICPLCHHITELHDSNTFRVLASMLIAAGHQLKERAIEIEAICPACVNNNEP
jgi:Fur family zinc uptake transcriptional regulator